MRKQTTVEEIFRHKSDWERQRAFQEGMARVFCRRESTGTIEYTLKKVEKSQAL